MKLTSILRKFPLALFLISILSCTNEAIDDLNLEENETTLSITQLNSAKNYKLLKKFKNCFSLVVEEEITETIIDEETGEVIETSGNEVEEDLSTNDYTEITFPITIILSNETTEVTITNIEDLIAVIETCNNQKQDCNKGEDETLSSTEINALLLYGYKRCFEVIIDEEATSLKNIVSKYKKSNRKYNYEDLTYPISIVFDNETVEIMNLVELKKITKTCRRRGCNDEEECTIAVELKKDYDGEGTTIYVESEVENLTYEWSTGETESYIYVFPTDTTTYTVNITDESGCSITESYTVEFNEN